MKLTLAEIRRLLNHILPDPPERNDITFRLHWSLWRRRHQTQARRTHYRRRLALQTHTI